MIGLETRLEPRKASPQDLQPLSPMFACFVSLVTLYLCLIVAVYYDERVFETRLIAGLAPERVRDLLGLLLRPVAWLL